MSIAPIKIGYSNDLSLAQGYSKRHFISEGDRMRSEATLDAVSRAADRWSDIADLVGRIALASLFLMSGVDKLFIHTAETIQLMQAYRVPLAGLLAYPSGVFELAAGLALAAGYRARLAALLLALFTAFVSPIFHAFWSDRKSVV